jgi:hypothetical protein
MAGFLLIAFIVAGMTLLGAVAMAFGVDSRYDLTDTRGVTLRAGLY